MVGVGKYRDHHRTALRICLLQFLENLAHSCCGISKVGWAILFERFVKSDLRNSRANPTSLFSECFGLAD
jgi:hypothetical protein